MNAISERDIQLNQKNIRYTLKFSRRARHMRLTVSCEGAVAVTLPRGLPEHKAEHFIRQKAAWILKKIEYFRRFKPSEVILDKPKHYNEHRNQAFLFVRDRVAHFQSHYGVAYRAITIKNQKTRWGSCSKKGNLNFNYKLLFLPPELADYLIVHELCHLREFNHSPRFWNLVRQTMPKYREYRKLLRHRAI